MLDSAFETAARFGRDVNLSCFIASTAGLLSHHLYFIRGNHTSNARDIIAVHLVGLGLLLYKALSMSGVSQGLSVYLTVSFAYFAALFASIGVYRIFFHPLRHIPGPFALKVTQLYMPWLGRDGQLHKRFLRLHEEYGDFVRVGESPAESVFDRKTEKCRAKLCCHSASGCTDGHTWPEVQVLQGGHGLLRKPPLQGRLQPGQYYEQEAAPGPSGSMGQSAQRGRHESRVSRSEFLLLTT
jgi:hypothetical protein